MRDYHAVLSVILKSYVDVQKKNGGHEWMFTYDKCELEKGQKSYLHFPCMTVNGDIQGHQQQCMRHKANNMSLVTHRCNMSRENCMKTGHVCDSFGITPIAALQEEYMNNET